MGRKHNPKTDAPTFNSNTWTDIYTHLQMLFLSVYAWSLPESINVPYLELVLYHLGSAVFFYDNRTGQYLALKYSPIEYDIYMEPLSVQPMPDNGDPFPVLNKGEFVIIRNNQIFKPSSPVVYEFARRLTDIRRTSDTNVFMQKIPFVFKGSENTQLSIIRMAEQITENHPYIVLNDKNNIVPPEPALLNPPMVLTELDDHFNVIMDDYLTRVGINNSRSDKKERQLTGEVDGNNGYILSSAYNYLSWREIACEQINKIWPDVNASVKLNEYRGVDNEYNNDGAEEPTNY